ncbi:hypothetical protein ACHAXM_003522 [Skeletonema potamos]
MENYMSFPGRRLVITSVLIPRPTAWMVAYCNEQHQPVLTLIEGYCGASDRPPTLMVGSDSISPPVLAGLRKNKVCTLSVATERDIRAAKYMASVDGNDHGRAMTFDEAGLRPCNPPMSILADLPMDSSSSTAEKNDEYYFKRPPAVDSSPVQMHCRLAMEVSLSDDSSSTMILLQIDTYIIKGNILRTQSTLHPGKSSIQGNPDVRSITAKIDCLLLRPLASMGNGRFGRVDTIYHMGRPRPRSIPTNRGVELSRSQMLINSCKPTTAGVTLQLDETTCNNLDWQSNSMWEIDDLVPACSLPPKYDNANAFEEGDGRSVSYTYRKDDICSLGYNPMKQVVCPRFIGWISTYEPVSLWSAENGGGGMPIAHISPYSFFIDVARGHRPMVAFAACPRSDEFANSDDSDSNSEQDARNEDGNGWKDAQRDAELTGVFCVNLVSEEMAWAMNASAAPLGKALSEFQLMNGGKQQDQNSISATRIIPTPLPAPQIRAPFVAESPLFLECKYMKTVKIPDIHHNDSMYSLIIGEIVNIHTRKDVITRHTTDGGREMLNLDIEKIKPVSRLGYGQEYTVVKTEIW